MQIEPFRTALEAGSEIPHLLAGLIN